MDAVTRYLQAGRADHALGNEWLFQITTMACAFLDHYTAHQDFTSVRFWVQVKSKEFSTFFYPLAEQLIAIHEDTSSRNGLDFRTQFHLSSFAWSFAKVRAEIEREDGSRGAIVPYMGGGTKSESAPDGLRSETGDLFSEDVFFKHVKNGDVESARSSAFLHANAKLADGRYSPDDYKTALYIAVFNRDFAMVQMLLDNGANPNIGSYLRTPLGIVAISGFEIARLLLAHESINPNLPNPYNKETPIEVACEFNNSLMIDLLVKHPKFEADPVELLQKAKDMNKLSLVKAVLEELTVDTSSPAIQTLLSSFLQV